MTRLHSLPQTTLIVAIVSLFTACFPSTTKAEGHEKTFGVTAGYVSRNNSAEAGLFFQYSFSKHLRLSADAELIFRNENRNAFYIDINAHKPFALGSRVDIYPFAGLAYSAWSHHVPVENVNQKVSAETNRSNRFGFNLGAGAGIRVTHSLKLFAEYSYTFTKHDPTSRVRIGIGHTF